MPFVLQLHLVMMSKFGVDTFNTFWVMGCIKVFAQQQQQSSDHYSSIFFFQNRQAKKEIIWINYLGFIKYTEQLFIM